MKLTPTMVSGLRMMAKDYKRSGFAAGHPTDNTARALEARGLVSVQKQVRGGWLYWSVTDEGFRVLAELDASNDK